MENGRRSEEQMDGEPFCLLLKRLHSNTDEGLLVCCYRIYCLQVWKDCKTAAWGPWGPEAQLYVEKDFLQSKTSSSMSQYESKRRNISKIK